MADPSTLRDLPEFFEVRSKWHERDITSEQRLQVDIGESLQARTDALGTFRELGPPDLAHIIKSAKAGTKDASLASLSDDRARLTLHADWLVSLHLRRGCVLVRFRRGLPQFLDIQHRIQLDLVRRESEIRMEDHSSLLLLFQCLFSR